MKIIVEVGIDDYLIEAVDNKYKQGDSAYSTFWCKLRIRIVLNFYKKVG